MPGQVWCVHEHRTYRGTHGSAALTAAAVWAQRIDGRHPHPQLETPHVELQLYTPANTGGYTAQLTLAQTRSLARVVEAVQHGDPELAEGMRAAAHLIAAASKEES